MNNIVIEVASVEDAEAILAIYRPYVEHTVITFEYDVPSVEEFRGRIAGTMERYPYLVAKMDGEIVGYAYAEVFKARKAYDHAVETTVYVKEGLTGCGVGRLLYEALEKALAMMHVINLNACIGYPEVEDEYLTKNSKEYHEHMGYRLVGEFRKCGYKFGRWYNMVWMEKMIGEHVDEPMEVVPFPEIIEEVKKAIKS